MQDQLDLWQEGDAVLEARFQEFHAANPHVYRALRRLALSGHRHGLDHGSINRLFEVLRWKHDLWTQGDEFKLNNSFRAFYARLLMACEPELAGWFEIRGRAA